MQNSQSQITDDNEKIETQCVSITLGSILASILNGVIGVIAAYFFKPLWNKIAKLWEEK